MQEFDPPNRHYLERSPDYYKNQASKRSAALLELMEIIEVHHGRDYTIIASLLPVANWYDVIGEETIADAILDGLVNSFYRY